MKTDFVIPDSGIRAMSSGTPIPNNITLKADATQTEIHPDIIALQNQLLVDLMKLPPSPEGKLGELFQEIFSVPKDAQKDGEEYTWDNGNKSLTVSKNGQRQPAYIYFRDNIAKKAYVLDLYWQPDPKLTIPGGATDIPVAIGVTKETLGDNGDGVVTSKEFYKNASSEPIAELRGNTDLPVRGDWDRGLRDIANQGQKNKSETIEVTSLKEIIGDVRRVLEAQLGMKSQGEGRFGEVFKNLEDIISSTQGKAIHDLYEVTKDGKVIETLDTYILPVDGGQRSINIVKKLNPETGSLQIANVIFIPGGGDEGTTYPSLLIDTRPHIDESKGRLSEPLWVKAGESQEKEIGLIILQQIPTSPNSNPLLGFRARETVDFIPLGGIDSILTLEQQSLFVVAF